MLTEAACAASAGLRTSSFRLAVRVIIRFRGWKMLEGKPSRQSQSSWSGEGELGPALNDWLRQVVRPLFICRKGLATTCYWFLPTNGNQAPQSIH